MHLDFIFLEHFLIYRRQRFFRLDMRDFLIYGAYAAVLRQCIIWYQSKRKMHIFFGLI